MCSATKLQVIVQLCARSGTRTPGQFLTTFVDPLVRDPFPADQNLRENYFQITYKTTNLDKQRVLSYRQNLPRVSDYTKKQLIERLVQRRFPTAQNMSYLLWSVQLGRSTKWLQKEVNSMNEKTVFKPIRDPVSSAH